MQDIKIGDLVRYKSYGHSKYFDSDPKGIGIVVGVDEFYGFYEVEWTDMGRMSDLIHSELEVLCE